MFIRSIRIANFKCFNEPTPVTFQEGLNLVVGENNSGKSTLLNLLRLQSISNIPHKTPYGHSQTKEPSIMCEVGLSKYDLLNLFGKEQPIKIFFNTFNPNLNIQLSNNYYKSLFFNNDIVYVWFNIYGKHAFFSDIDRAFSEGQKITGKNLLIDFDLGTATTSPGIGHDKHLFEKINDFTWRKVFTLSSERQNVARYQVEDSTRSLQPNGANLPSVLNTIANQDIPIYGRIISNVREIFPEVTHISTPIINGSFRITIWYSNPSEMDNQIKYPLDHCGSGLNQIILLFTALNLSREPKIFLIDEPQSYLHPRSIRVLFDILKREYSENQYIIATHSPFVIKAAENCPINFLKRNSKFETEVHLLDLAIDTDIQKCLSDLDIKFSDIFGIDKIIWVEGESDKRILSYLAENNSLCSQDCRFIPVINTGDFSGKKNKLRQIVIDLYKEWSKVAFNPNMSILFDGDQKKILSSKFENDDSEISAQSNVHFLNRFMIENYFLNQKVIENYLLNIEGNVDKTADEIRNKVNEVFENYQEFISERERHYKEDNKIDDENWKLFIHGKKFLNEIFFAVLGRDYEEIFDGIRLCELLVNENDEDIQMLVEELKILVNE